MGALIAKRSIGPCRSLITATVKDSRDYDVLVVPVIDDIALDCERADPFAEFRPMATHARLFDEQLESIEDGVDESIGNLWARIFGDVEQISWMSCSAGWTADRTSTISWRESHDLAT